METNRPLRAPLWRTTVAVAALLAVGSVSQVQADGGHVNLVHACVKMEAGPGDPNLRIVGPNDACPPDTFETPLHWLPIEVETPDPPPDPPSEPPAGEAKPPPKAKKLVYKQLGINLNNTTVVTEVAQGTADDVQGVEIAALAVCPGSHPYRVSAIPAVTHGPSFFAGYDILVDGPYGEHAWFTSIHATSPFESVEFTLSITMDCAKVKKPKLKKPGK